MTDTLFSEADTTVDANTRIGEYDPNTDYRSQLVGEGRKYANDNMLAYSRLVADQHIDDVHKEQAGLRAELKSRITVEEALAKLQQSQTPNNDTRPTGGSEPANTNSAPNEVDVAKLVDEKLNQYAAQRTRQENLARTATELRKSFGDNYKPRLNEITNVLGTTPEFMDNLAATNPTAFLRMVGVGVPEPAPKGDGAPTRSSFNTESFVPRGPVEKKWSDYEKLRRSNPNLYWQPKVQNELTALIAKHGETYFET